MNTRKFKAMTRLVEERNKLRADRDQLLKAAKEVLPIMRGYIKDIGGCDHQVGICCCADIRACDALELAVAQSITEK